MLLTDQAIKAPATSKAPATQADITAPVAIPTITVVILRAAVRDDRLHIPFGRRSARGLTALLHHVSVDIPTLNEAKNFEHLLPMIPRWVHKIIVVDGCSTDNTVEVANEFAKKLPIRNILELKKGKGAVLRSGFEAATGEAIVAMDADCSMRPNEMLVVVSTLARAIFAQYRMAGAC